MSNAALRIDDDADPEAEADAQLEEAVRIGLADPVRVPHEVVREWLLALARGERPPPPLP